MNTVNVVKRILKICNGKSYAIENKYQGKWNAKKDNFLTDALFL